MFILFVIIYDVFVVVMMEVDVLEHEWAELLTFCGIRPKAVAMTSARSAVRLVTMEPKETTTTPASAELCTKASKSWRK